MVSVTCYDVYVLNPDGWALRQRFASDDKAEAMSEARMVEAQTGRPTKVVREIYDPDGGGTGEQVVYLSPLLQKGGHRMVGGGRGAPSRQMGGSGSFGDRPRPNARMPSGLEVFGAASQEASGSFGQGGGSRPRVVTTSDLLGRVTLVIIASLILATVGTALIPALFSMLNGMGLPLGPGDSTDLLFGLFMALFVVSILGLGRKLIPISGVLAEQKKPKTRAAARQPTGQAPAKPETGDGTEEGAPPPDGDADADSGGEGKEGETQGPDPNFDPVALMDEDKERAAAEAEEDPLHARAQRVLREAEEAARRQQEEEKARKEKEQAKAARKAEEEAARKAEAEAKAKAKAKAKAESESPPVEETKAATTAEEGAAATDAEPDGAGPSPLAPEVEEARKTAMNFLGGAVAVLKEARPQLDTFARFGVNLYLAGACASLAEARGLESAAHHAMLREMLEVLGTRPALATMFLDKLEEYALEPRNMHMMQAGRDAMSHLLVGSVDPHRELPKVLDSWTNPQARTLPSSTIAIVFTDMVGSTDINSRVGDLRARELTRAHNSVVRSALARHDGREVKHTGDGIMAVFPIVSQAVEAMIDVQRAVEGHNHNHPDMAFHLRIGVNAGEPEIEENDYYGLAVTLAARICGEAGPGDILCSAVVRDLGRGKSLVFRPRGQAFLKGISDPQALFEAVWREEDLARAVAEEAVLEEAAEEAALAAGRAAREVADPDESPDPAAPDAPGSGDRERA